MQVIDYTKEHKGTLIAQGKGRNFLSLTKSPFPIGRADGKRVSYIINHRWLSQDCNNPNDQSWACVQGQEHTYWSKKELDAINPDILSKRVEVDLFDCFNLF